MKKTIIRTSIIVFAFILILPSFQLKSNSKGNKNINNETSTQQQDTLNVTLESGNNKYCYINKIKRLNNKTYIIVDYIRFLWNDEAIEAAKIDGYAEMEVNNGDTTYFVYNDYYIVNNNPKLRTFLVSDSVIIDLVYYDPNAELKSGFKLKDIINKEFGYSDTPFVIDVKDGLVYRISEQYVP